MLNKYFFYTATMVILCLAFAGELSAQPTARSKRPEPPSWLRPPHRRPQPPKPAVHAAYKPSGYSNVLTANPGILVIDDFAAVGVGGEYERFLSKSGRLSIAVSGAACMPLGYPKLDEAGGTVMRSGFTILPAALYHLTGNASLVDCSFGLAPGLLILSTDIHDRTSSTNHVDKSGVVLAQTNLALHHMGRFVFGFHMSGGVLLNTERGGHGIFQFGLKCGSLF